MGYAYNVVEGTFAFSKTSEQAQNLLRRNEVLPERVGQSLKMLDQLGVWYIVSRNSTATSCRDAVSRRNRLGNQGIPLWDELKTMAAVYYGPQGDRHLVLLHCRAHQQFDLERVQHFFQSKRPIAKMSHDELEHAMGAGYGTVNPFNAPQDMIQVFDEGVLQNFQAPHSMMTNGGDRTWGIEFRPQELITRLQQQRGEQMIRVASICQVAQQQQTQKPIYGIVTGNGPDSGIALWRQLNAFIAEGLGNDFKGDLSYPQVMMRSIPEMGLSMELAPREEEVWHHLSQAILGLCSDGATHIALACHTTHYFTKQIKAICEGKATFVSMAETVLDYVHKEQITDLTIMGIPYVSDLAEWSAYRDLKQINTQALGKKAREPMLELGYLIKKMTSEKDHRDALNKLHHVLRTGVNGESVLIALTEISVLLEHFPKNQKKIGKFNIIDALRLYGKRLAQIYLDYLSFDINDEDIEW